MKTIVPMMASMSANRSIVLLVILQYLCLWGLFVINAFVRTGLLFKVHLNLGVSDRIRALR